MDINHHAQDEEIMNSAEYAVEVDTFDLESAVRGLCDVARFNRQAVRAEAPRIKEAADKLNELITVMEG